MAIVPPVIVVMEKACRNAAKSLIRDFGELEKLQISKKDKNDFVSSADIRASESISYTLGKDRPDFLQIDEETFSAKDLDKLKGDTPVFISDPLDGTKNFIHGNGYFAVTITPLVNNDGLYDEDAVCHLTTASVSAICTVRLSGGLTFIGFSS